MKNTILTGLLRHTKTNLCIHNRVFGISRSLLFFAIISLTSGFVERTHIIWHEMCFDYTYRF